MGTTADRIDQREDYIQGLSVGRKGLGGEHIAEAGRGSRLSNGKRIGRRIHIHTMTKGQAAKQASGTFRRCSWRHRQGREEKGTPQVETKTLDRDQLQEKRAPGTANIGGHRTCRQQRRNHSHDGTTLRTSSIQQMIFYSSYTTPKHYVYSSKSSLLGSSPN